MTTPSNSGQKKLGVTSKDTGLTGTIVSAVKSRSIESGGYLMVISDIWMPPILERIVRHH